MTRMRLGTKMVFEDGSDEYRVFCPWCAAPTLSAEASNAPGAVTGSGLPSSGIWEVELACLDLALRTSFAQCFAI